MKDYVESIIKERIDNFELYKDKPRFIIVGTPTYDSSEFVKVLQNAIDKGHGIAIIKQNDNRGIHVESNQDNEIFFGISTVTFEPMIFQGNDYYMFEQIQEQLQEQLCDAISIEETLLTIGDIRDLKKKKKTFQENFGYVKRKFR